MANTRKAQVDEDEDLDDLDDVLDQFTPPPAKGQTQVPPPSTTTTSKPAADKSTSGAQLGPAGLDGIDLSDDFARELTLGMESLMREIASEAGLNAEGMKGTGELADDGEQTEEDKKREEAFKAAWEKMLVEGMNGALDIDELTKDASSKGKEKEAGSDAKSAAEQAGIEDDSFQASIRKAMEKLKESDSNLQADAPDSVEAMMAQLTEGLGDLSGGESEEELQTLLEGMMTQLMSKEILYEPLKELHTKFPEYLKDNAETISADDKKRYNAQYAVVEKIVSIFDDPSYSDEDKGKGAEVVTLVNEMQSYGSPPADIMGPLPPGLDLGPDGIPNLPDGCIIA